MTDKFLNTELERLISNYCNARKSWEGWCFLSSFDIQNQDVNFRDFVNKNDFLIHCRYILFKDINIELYKILKESNSSKDNIFKLLRKQNQENSNELLKKISELKNEIDIVLNVRDKFYAHLDKDYNSFLLKFDLNNYYKIFELIEKGIIALGGEKKLKEFLNSIPSRNNFSINPDHSNFPPQR